MKYIFETYLNIISEEQNPFDKNKYYIYYISSNYNTHSLCSFVL